MPSTKSLPLDRVDKATQMINRGIGQLAAQLGDPDLQVVRKAFSALDALGPRAIVGPLANGLARASSPEHRGYLVAAVIYDTQESNPRALRALLLAQKREEHPAVAALLKTAITKLTFQSFRPRPAANPSPPSAEEDGSEFAQ